MKLANRLVRVPLSSIHVPRADRQRKEVNTEGLLSSIKARGVVSPIIIRPAELFDETDKPFVLVAGERRLTCSLELGLPDIPTRQVSDLTPVEAKIIELEENVKRKGLSWREECEATAKLHEAYVALSPDWTVEQTASELGFGLTWVKDNLRVYRQLSSPKIAGAEGLRAAWNILSREDSRRASSAVADIIDAGRGLFAKAEPEPEPGAPHPAPAPPSADSILPLDFTLWAPSYSGPKFSFIHCDFPYGINLFAGKLSGRDAHTTYDDKPSTYWELLHCLCDNLDKIMSHSGHLMFWFAMEHYAFTLARFREWAPSLAVQTYPLIWVKSDNVGIMPDPKRGPRRVYETALIASREDKFIAAPVANAYSCPTDKAHHGSTKPVPMLKHFFRMFVDETTTLLDPTCGSGSALRAAEDLGAAGVLGLEKDPEHYAAACSALRSSRLLRRVSP
jgi:ParB/RepB/Spo0J family partition protein